MFSALIVLGLILILFLPIYTTFYIAPKLIDQNRKETLHYLSMVPGIIVIAISVVFRQDISLQVSHACGTVKFYKTYTTRGGSFERIVIQFENSAYYRYLMFDENLQRKKSNDQVCFEYLDKYKNENTVESKILKWMDR